MFANWTSPDGNTEFATSLDRQSEHRVLFVPALFEEGNKLRRLTVEIMRRVHAAGIDCFLPDLPGCHESLTPLEDQSLDSWKAAIATASDQFGATHLMTIRGGASLVPIDLPGWRYAPVTGARVLRGLLRARVVSSRESGLNETTEQLTATGIDEGLTLAGYQLSPKMVSQLAEHKELTPTTQIELLQSDIGGAGLWLKAEPSESKEQADALAGAIVAGLRS